jgi:site-specific DNA-methyltransferase (adenine-specific)
MGSGSTVAAAEAVGYSCIGLERYKEYYMMSQQAIPKLSQLSTRDAQLSLSFT